MDGKYRMVGNVVIAEAQREEVNKHVLDLLDKCGIRKTGEMVVGNSTVPVYHKAVPNEEGMVLFDYSVFEGKKRTCSSYNMNTCELISDDRGYNEFGLVMNMILLLLESFSVEPCYLLSEEEVFWIGRYVAVINNVLGIELRFPNREKMWDMLQFMRKQNYTKNTGKKIWDAFDSNHMKWYINHFMSIICIEFGNFDTEPSGWDGNKEDLKTLKMGKLDDAVYEICSRLLKAGEGEKLRKFLQILVTSSVKEREEISLKEDEYGCLALISLRMFPPVLLAPYALLAKEDFWTVYDEFTADADAYTDILECFLEGGEPGAHTYSTPFWTVVQNDDADRFLGIMKVDVKCLSEKMLQCIATWKNEFSQIPTGKKKELEELLGTVLKDVGIEYIPAEFIDICNCDKVIGWKVVDILEKMLDEHKVLFPEVPRNQRVKLLRNLCTGVYSRQSFVSFMQLVANRDICKEILGV